MKETCAIVAWCLVSCSMLQRLPAAEQKPLTEKRIVEVVSALRFDVYEEFKSATESVLRDLGPQAVPQLLDLLGKEEQKQRWDDILWALGILASVEPTTSDPRAIMNFLDGVTTSTTLSVKVKDKLLVSGFGTLGRMGGPEARSYLLARCDPDHWQRHLKDTGWNKELIRYLCIFAGYGLAHLPDAEQVIGEQARREAQGRKFLPDYPISGIELAVKEEADSKERRLKLYEDVKKGAVPAKGSGQLR